MNNNFQKGLEKVLDDENKDDENTATVSLLRTEL